MSLIPSRCIAILVLIASSSAAFSQSDTKTVTPDKVVELLKNEGFRSAEVLDQDKQIVRYKSEGLSIIVLVDKDGGALQCYFKMSGTMATLRKINDWNKSKRFSRAYLNDDGDPTLESDLSVRRGVSEESVEGFLALFGESVKAFVKEVCE